MVRVELSLARACPDKGSGTMRMEEEKGDQLLSGLVSLVKMHAWTISGNPKASSNDFGSPVGVLWSALSQWAGLSFRKS